MKFSYLLTTFALLALPSCEKIRSFSGKLGKTPPSAPATPYAGDQVSELTESGYEAFRQMPGRVIIVDFYADWCGPCRQLGPILHGIAAEKHGLVLVGKINVDKAPALAAKEGVHGIPDVRIFRDGKQVDRFVGLPEEAEVRQRIERQLKGLAPLAVEAPKPAPTTAPTTAATTAAKPTPAPETKKANVPLLQPMSKDWMPPGIHRR